ncbi:hypothetical protein SASPL_130741 [Salvia splendens]|uniref:Uncharacterized protein n=1 Tax=Salvia splendens TaxID=180675 RepID=A0A8X8ZKY3_SALSN|nr:hypothetical protein SASPL_130741 [Salvia splendens]
MIAATRGGWAIEASIGAVGALKDQLGVCRWNYVIRIVEQRAKSRVQTYYYKHVVSPASAAGAPSDSRAPAGNMLGLQERAERREQRVKKGVFKPMRSRRDCESKRMFDGDHQQRYGGGNGHCRRRNWRDEDEDED